MMGWRGYAGLDWTAVVFLITLVGILFWALRSSLSGQPESQDDTVNAQVLRRVT